MVLGFSSASSLATFSLPSYSVASSSTIGAIILHGPHHSAQKSTSTSSLASSTSDSNVSSVTANGFAILLLLLSLDELYLCLSDVVRPPDLTFAGGVL